MVNDIFSLEEQSMLERASRCIQLIEADSLSIEKARWFTCELPTHYYKHGYYAESVHTICNDCHRKLWKYCLDKGYIDKIDYEEFTEHGMIHFKLEDKKQD